MTRRSSAMLITVVVALVAAGQLFAAAGPRLEGRLSDPASALILQPQTSLTLPAGHGKVTIAMGELRSPANRRTEASGLCLDGTGLAPESRYMLIAGGTPLLSFAADAAGRVSARFVAGLPRPGWKSLPPAVATRLEGATNALRVVSLSDAATTKAPQGLAKDGRDGYWDWTPLCSADGAAYGETSVSEFEGYSYFSAFGSGLAPGANVTLRANAIDVGTVQADDWGFVWIDADAGEGPGGGGQGSVGALFDLPEALLPVSVIASVELVVGGEAVLAGDYTDPCMEEPPMPIEGGSIQLCGEDSSWAFGWFDWALFDSGLEIANFYAYGLESGLATELKVDGTTIATGQVADDGSLWFVFSSEPQEGELPLPAEVRPLSETEEVVLSAGSGTLLSGTPDTICPWPEPVESGWTALCFPDGGGGTPDGRGAGDVFWTVYNDGTEELWVSAYGLAAAVDLGLTIDGNLLGTYPSDEWGSLWLGFSTSEMPGTLPIPDVIRPVSGIDRVALDQDGTVVASGSFSDPCVPPPPPPPIEYGWTSLCPPDGSSLFGDASWMVYEGGLEELYVGGWGFEPLTQVELVVDGHDLGAFTVDDWGGLYLNFSSDPQGEWQLPLPEDVRPVAAIDLVSLLVGTTPLLEGSFSEPCVPEPPPMPIESNYTMLCPEGTTPASGDVYWAIWEDGYEELYFSAYFLTADAPYELVVDGFSLGTFTADSWGYIFVSFASDPLWDGVLPLPAEIRPVSGIDVVELQDAGDNVVAAGSFSEPCTESVTFSGNSTGLCGGDELMYGMGSWWTMSLRDTIVAEGIDIDLWPPNTTASYRVLIDGIEVGNLEQSPDTGTLRLSLGTYAESPVPPELEPIEEIDVITILDEDGTVLYQGSFSEPCALGYDIPGALAEHRSHRAIRQSR